MTYTQEITLDLNANSAPPIVYAKQTDTESRQLLVHFTQDDAEYLVNHNNSVALRIQKPDGKQIMNYAIINNDGTVTVTLTQQCLAVAGRAYADLAEFNSQGQILSTAPFVLNVVASPDVMGSEAISSNEFSYLASFIEQGADIVGQAQEWANGYNGDAPVSSSNPAYNNNAKYWSNQAANIANNMGIVAGTPVAPGTAPVVTKSGSTFTLGLPTVKPHATISVTEGESASASVVVSNSSEVGANELAILQKSFDFSFVLPKGDKGNDAGFSNDVAVQVNTLSASENATASIEVIDSPDTAKQFKFIFGIPRGEAGINGNTIVGPIGPTGARGPAGPSITSITSPNGNTLRFEFDSRDPITVSGYTGGSAAVNLSYVNDNGNLVVTTIA